MASLNEAFSSSEELKEKTPKRISSQSKGLKGRLFYFLLGTFVFSLWVIYPIFNSRIVVYTSVALLLIFSLFSILFKFPEYGFVLFLFAGTYKEDPRLSFLPDYFDLTIFFYIFTILAYLYGLHSKQFKFVFPPRKLLIPYLCLVIYASVGLMYTPVFDYGLSKLLRFAFLTGFKLIFPCLALNEQTRLNRFFLGIIGFGLLMAIDLLAKNALSHTIVRVSFGTNYLGVGRTLGAAGILSFLYYLYAKKISGKIFYFLTFGVLTFGLLVSAGRGPQIAFGLAILFILSLLISLWVFRKTSPRVFPSMTVSLALAYISLAPFSHYYEVTQMRWNVMLQEKAESYYFREKAIKNALLVLESFPEAITGLGIGGFGKFSTEPTIGEVHSPIFGARTIYPHNIFLEIISELGIIGLGIFLYMFIQSWATAFKIAKYYISNQRILHYLCVLSMFVFYLSNAMVSGDINDNSLFFCSIGLIYALSIQQFSNK